MLDEYRESLRNWLESLGLPENFVNLLDAITGLVLVVLITVAVYYLFSAIANRLIPLVLKRISTRIPQRWTEALQSQKVARRSAHILSAVTAYWLIPYALEAYPRTLLIVQNVIEGYVVIVAVIAINAFLRAVGDVLSDYRDGERIRIKIAAQALQGVVIAIGAVVFLSVVFNTSITVLMSGLAGMAAVLILFFKDSILGFVAGVQLSENDMLRMGDWIEVPKYGAEGTVQDVRLTTVKVRNFDKTISTIPTYALVSDSFKNWRGMRESGVRRVKRAIIIDMESIGFLPEKKLQELMKVELLQPYLENQLSEIETYNQKFAAEKRYPPNTRGLTNLGTLRVYLENYLKHHPFVDQATPIMARQLAPSPQGLPLEIYAFLTEQNWVEYEKIQSDIFEHIFAIMPLFELKVFQQTVGVSLEA